MAAFRNYRFSGRPNNFFTFSAEVTRMIQDGFLITAFATILLHVLGSLVMTFVGIYLFKLIK
jgi:CrcB protein